MKTKMLFCLASVLCLTATVAEAQSFDYYMAHKAERIAKMKECRDYMDRNVHGPDDIRAFFKTARGVDCSNADHATQRKFFEYKDPTIGKHYKTY